MHTKYRNGIKNWLGYAKVTETSSEHSYYSYDQSVGIDLSHVPTVLFNLPYETLNIFGDNLDLSGEISIPTGKSLNVWTIPDINYCDVENVLE